MSHVHRLIIVIIATVSAVFNVVAAEEIPVVRFTVTNFDISGDNPLSDAETQATLAPFLGEHEGLDGLVEAARELEGRILAAGHSFHRVILPPQTVNENRIILQVVVFKIAKIDVIGNKHFSSENIMASLPSLTTGGVPDTQALSRDLLLANSHPSKQVTLRIKSSKVPDSIDAELEVQDRRPWQFFSALNNIGNEETGRFRLSAGYQHSNVTGHDDSVTFSYTTSPGHFSEVKQFGVNYGVPVYSLNSNLYFFYSRSDVDSGRVEQVFDVSGAGKFLGVHITHTLLNMGNYRHRAKIGFEDRLFENNIDFQGTEIGVDIRGRPLTLSYSGEFRFERSNLDFDLSYSRNTGGGGKNSDQVYAQARTGADESWQVFRFSAHGNFLMRNRWLISGRFNMQYSDEPLISGEQFGIGGANSIRGFEERAVSGDMGVSGNIEFISPPLSKINENLNIFAFLDGGYVNQSYSLPGQLDSETLLSLGMGLRWSWNNQLNLVFSYGHEINGTFVADAGGAKAHMALFYRF